MIVWGGYGGQACCDFGALGDGGRYDPAADHWTAIGTNGAPMASQQHSAVWTGSENDCRGGWVNLNPEIFLNETWSYFPNGPNLRISLTPTNSAVLAWPGVVHSFYPAAKLGFGLAQLEPGDQPGRRGWIGISGHRLPHRYQSILSVAISVR